MVVGLLNATDNDMDTWAVREKKKKKAVITMMLAECYLRQ